MKEFLSCQKLYKCNLFIYPFIHLLDIYLSRTYNVLALF